jgi:hypothetical protein
MRVSSGRVGLIPGIAALTAAALLAGCGSSSAPSTGAAQGTTGAATTQPTAASPASTATAAPAHTPVPTVAPWPSKGPLQAKWEAHGPVTDKTSTTSVAIDPVSGNVWVGVPFENLFWIVRPDGKYLESWGKAGTGDGQFDFSDHAQTPDGWAPIAFAPDGSFYVGDTGNHRVEEFDPQRHFVRAWGSFGTDDGQFVQITSIATDGKEVFVGDGERYDIQAFTADGTFERSFGENEGYSAIAVDGHGLIHATNAQNPRGALDKVAVMDASGNVQWEVRVSQPGYWPAQSAVDASGNTYLSIELASEPYTAIGIVKLDPSGALVGAWDGGGDAVAVSPAGDVVYVVRGIQLDGTQWTSVKAFALGGS